ncbi:MAG: hydrogenase, partial [Muribaculaceae bacterium]|nr:hydrogenase [Muribaculaceae bacterium]
LQIPMTEPHALDFISVKEAHGFAAAGGVAGAVKSYLKLDAEKLKEINAIEVANLDKRNIALLSSYARSGKAPGRFIEVMACEGGCITGPSSATIAKDGKRRFDKELSKQEKTY